MPRTWTGPAPEDITAWTLIQASHIVARRFHAALSAVGLTPTQFGVLLQLDLYPEMANGELARAVLVTPQTMSELTASLHRLGHIERDTPAGRGRRKPARLTAGGRAVLHRCDEAIAEVQRSLGLSAEESADLNALLRIVNAS